MLVGIVTDVNLAHPTNALMSNKGLVLVLVLGLVLVARHMMMMITLIK